MEHEPANKLSMLGFTSSFEHLADCNLLDIKVVSWQFVGVWGARVDGGIGVEKALGVLITARSIFCLLLRLSVSTQVWMVKFTKSWLPWTSSSLQLPISFILSALNTTRTSRDPLSTGRVCCDRSPSLNCIPSRGSDPWSGDQSFGNLNPMGCSVTGQGSWESTTYELALSWRRFSKPCCRCCWSDCLLCWLRAADMTKERWLSWARSSSCSRALFFT